MSDEYNKTPLKGAINKFMEVYKLDRKYNLVEVKNAWKVVMGEYINGKTHSLFMSGTVLRVKLHSSVIKEEILYAKSKVMRDLNEKIGRNLVEDIIFVD